MAGSVKSRLNHYQLLGVWTGASSDEIARAFARESSVFRPHLFGALTEVCLAYETLRDPVKRRAYDDSIGLKREPNPPKLFPAVRGTATAESMMRAAPVERRSPLSVSEPKPGPAPVRPALPLGPGADSNIRPSPSIDGDEPFHLPLEEALGSELRPIDGRRTAIILGGFVLAACALGGLAGWWSAGDIGEASQPDNEVSVPPPAAERVPPAAAEEATPVPVPPAAMQEARIDRPVRAAAPIEPTPAAPEPASVEAAGEQGEPAPGSSEPASDEAAAVPTVAASMPLPTSVIARTIERIGYSCGSVTSATPVEGEAAGVYKINCSSGQSYQAKPVNGRYRFRRWGRR